MNAGPAPLAPAFAPLLPPPPVRLPVPLTPALTAPPAFRPDAWAGVPGPATPVTSAAPVTPAASLRERGQALMAKVADAIFPLKPPAQPGALAITYTLGEKIKQVGRSTLFFAIPVGGAALLACGLGWAVGPFVPFIGGHVIGAAAATLLIGQTAGTLLHGAMRLPLVTRPEDRELNSAGATIASAGLGTAFAWGIAAAAGATITPWILLGGAVLGAAPRVMEWMGGKALS